MPEPLPERIRQDYRSDLYVERNAALRTALAWLTGPKRLLRITSPPAIGKTWFLSRLKEQFANAGGAVTLWLNVSDVLSLPEDETTPTGEISQERTAIWLEQFTRQIRLEYKCVEAPQYDPARNTAIHIEALSRHICQSCFAGRIVCLFIDGGDEATEEGWDKFERYILEPFSRVPEMQFVIALRDEQRVQSPTLLWNELHLELGTLSSDSTGRQHLKKLARVYAPSLDVNTLVQDYEPYDFCHPGINMYIFIEEVRGGTLNETSFLHKSLSEINFFSPVPSELVALLLQIATSLDNTWLSSDLAHSLAITDSKVWEHINQLQNYCLITNVEEAPQRFQITGGLLGFVRAAQRRGIRG